jgi:hypothetical protein
MAEGAGEGAGEGVGEEAGEGAGSGAPAASGTAGRGPSTGPAASSARAPDSSKAATAGNRHRRRDFSGRIFTGTSYTCFVRAVQADAPGAHPAGTTGANYRHPSP